jgi:hypothetical protein
MVRVSGFLTSAGTGLPTSATKTITGDYKYKQTRESNFFLNCRWDLEQVAKEKVTFVWYLPVPSKWI